ncbi:facilitated trehalose transporter Tret1-like [Phymastichus coffea]|uniref:facilitated trehalose transporter Tret1-like n=1 Tax=Phymastichus coffea TaxID=108790 RepID=UPI00273A8DFB|nr:facilitated trehalose transporter Tret1-like [Phymastichus coffea]
MSLACSSDAGHEQSDRAPLVGSSVQSEEGQIGDERSPRASKLRRVASQLCGVLASGCLRFTTSSFTGFHIILIAELHGPSPSVPVTLDQLTWFASLSFPSILGSVANGFVTQRLGSRVVMLSSTLLLATCWLLYHFATSVTMLLLGRVLYAVTAGAVKTPSSTYITEISQAHLRGSFLASSHLAATFGAFFSLLLASMVHWRTVALVNLVFPLVTAVAVLLTPDSPVWLASKGRLDDAERALSWLRGWVRPVDVRAEYRALVDNVRRAPPEEERAPGWSRRLRRHFRAFLRRSFYLPLGTISLVFGLHFLSGVAAIQTYSGVLFAKMHSPFRESIATAAMGATRVLGALIILFCIQCAGKRKLVFFSLVVAGLCHLLVALLGFLDLEAEYLWASPILVIVAVFANAAGVETIVHMLNSEIFPVSVRYIGSAIGSSISAVIASIVNKVFLYVVDGITLPAVFLFFAVVNAVALLTYYFLFPETEGRSLKEIEDHFTGIRDLNEPKN